MHSGKRLSGHRGRRGRVSLLLGAGSALGLLGIVVVAGCSSDPPKRPPVESNTPVQPGIGGVPGGNTDAGVADSGKNDGGGSTGVDAGKDAAPATCTDVVNVGGVIDQLAVADDLPPGTGGNIVDGTYTAIDAKVYVGINGQPGLTNATYQTTITIAGQAFERVQSFKSSGGVVTNSRVSGTLIPNGVNGTISLTCPNALLEQITFTVGVNTLTLGNPITKELFLFSKKP